MSDFDLDWDKFVGFCLFTLDEELIFDKVVNSKTSFSTIYHIIDTSGKTRDELKKSNVISLTNDVFRVDYNLFFTVVLGCMFLPSISDDNALKIIEVIKKKMIEQLKDYGSIEKMETRSQGALIKRLGSLVSERTCSQLKNDFYAPKKAVPVKPEGMKTKAPTIESLRKESQQVEAQVEAKTVPVKPEGMKTKAPTIESLRKESQQVEAKTEAQVEAKTEAQVEAKTEAKKTQLKEGDVEDLLEFIGVKADESLSSEPKEKRTELTEQLLEETKRASIERVLSSVIKGLSEKTGVCFVHTGESGTLETLSYGMSEKHAKFVLGILSKYPEIVQQTLAMDGEKTLDAGDGVVVLEEAETGILVSITKNKDEISEIAKRLTVVKTLVDQFLKTAF